MFSKYLAHEFTYAYIFHMKKPLNISLDENLISEVKKYAEANEISISSMVEDYFETLLRPKRSLKENVSLVEFVKKMPENQAEFEKDIDWKRDYYFRKGAK